MTASKREPLDRRGFFRSLFGRRESPALADTTTSEVVTTVRDATPAHATSATSAVPGVVSHSSTFSLDRFYAEREAKRAPIDIPPPPRSRGPR